MIEKINIIKELVGYLWTQKQWWLIPPLLILLIFGLLILFAGTSGLAPFIYPLF